MTTAEWIDKLLGMSLYKVLQAEDEFLPVTFVLFIGLPLACWFCGYLLRKGNGRGPMKFLFVLLLIFASLPGIGFTLYFFLAENSPDVSIYCYALPVLSLVLAIVLAGMNRDLLFKRAKPLNAAPPQNKLP